MRVIDEQDLLQICRMIAAGEISHAEASQMVTEFTYDHRPSAPAARSAPAPATRSAPRDDLEVSALADEALERYGRR